MKQLVVYVAGKFSGATRADVEANIAAAVALGVEVARAGHIPVIPHSNTGAPEFCDVQGYEWWCAATMELLRRSDAVCLVSNWIDSPGARAEAQQALWSWKPVWINRVPSAGDDDSVAAQAALAAFEGSQTP